VRPGARPPGEGPPISAPATAEPAAPAPASEPPPATVPALAGNPDDSKPWRSSPTPDVTVAQCLALAAFGLLAGIAVFNESVVTSAEYGELKRLCIFLIAALLPSDALIRFGRARFMARQRTDATREKAHNGGEGAKAAGAPEEFPSHMRPTTLGQALAFTAFVVVCIAGTVNLFSANEFGDIAETASYLIAALLPSEATVRFGRALWLRNVPTAQVTDQALKKI